MSLLIFVYRHQDIIRRKSELNMKLMLLKQKLFDLQSYASSIADGSVSMNDLMNAPASQFNRMSIFMQYSHQAALQGAQEKFAVMSQVPGAIPQMQNAELQQRFSQMMFKSFYEQEKEKFNKVEQKVLNDQDKRIEQEVASIETQLKMLDAEEQKVTEAEDKAAEKGAPKYVA
ncbi:MAG: hypothetical protein WCY19_04065 [Candidatus Gastranaerophilaceae bacterium]